MRFPMIQRNELAEITEEARFPEAEIQEFRTHRAKCTLPTLAQHQGMSKKGVRMQGAWRGKNEDKMPDAYLRAKQLFALELKEKCMTYIQEGGTMPSLVTSALEPALLPEPVTTGTSEENGEMTTASPLDSEMEGIIPEIKEAGDTESQKAKIRCKKLGHEQPP